MDEDKKIESVRATLVDDGTGEIFFWIPEGTKQTEYCLIGVQDGGGYSSVFVTRENWEEMKKKVDALIAEHFL